MCLQCVKRGVSVEKTPYLERRFHAPLARRAFWGQALVVNTALLKPRAAALLGLLLIAGRASAYNETIAYKKSPGTSRIVKVNFFVDNKSLLEKPFLEVSVMQDTRSRRVVSLENGLASSIGAGVSEITVPEGAVQLAVCGLVKCSSTAETELVCGKTAIPATIDVLYQHEVTFSTSFACQADTPQLAQHGEQARLR